MNSSYQLRYLPIFYDDVISVTSYIKIELLNPKAASDLIDAVENAILERLPVCESFEPQKRHDKYHLIKVCLFEHQ